VKQQVRQLYEYFYQLSTGNQNFEFKPKENERKMIDNFIAKLTPSHGEDWLFHYMCYQFSRYCDQKTRFGKGIVFVGWIFGPAALERYKNATDEEKYWGEQFKERFLAKNPLIKPLSIKIDISYKNRERTRFKQLERQFLHCSEMNLFEERNKICMFCKSKELCNKK